MSRGIALNEGIVRSRQWIQIHRDAIQLSLQTIILQVGLLDLIWLKGVLEFLEVADYEYRWNQNSRKDDRFSDLESLQTDIRRLDTNLDIEIHGLEEAMSTDNPTDLYVKHLRELVCSAAAVLASIIKGNSRFQEEELPSTSEFSFQPNAGIKDAILDTTIEIPLELSSRDAHMQSLKTYQIFVSIHRCRSYRHATEARLRL